MRRVVVTGMGIVCSLGNNQAEVLASLREGRSGIRYKEQYKEMGMRSQVAGQIVGLDMDALIDRKQKRFMGDAAAYAYISLKEARFFHRGPGGNG